MKPRENGVQLGYPSMGDRVKKLRKQKAMDIIMLLIKIKKIFQKKF